MLRKGGGADFCFYGRADFSEKKSTQTFFVQIFSTTLRVVDVRAKNRGRPHQKVRFPAAPVVGRNSLTPGHPGVRVRSVRGKSGPKSLCLCCFFLPCKKNCLSGWMALSSHVPLPMQVEFLIGSFCVWGLACRERGRDTPATYGIDPTVTLALSKHLTVI